MSDFEFFDDTDPASTLLATIDEELQRRPPLPTASPTPVVPLPAPAADLMGQIDSALSASGYAPPASNALPTGLASVGERLAKAKAKVVAEMEQDPGAFWGQYAFERTPFLGAIGKAGQMFQVNEDLKAIKGPRGLDAGQAAYDRVARFLIYQERMNERTSIPERAMDIGTALPGFGVEFGLTGGTYAAGRAAATKALGGAVGGALRRGAVKTAAGAVGAAAQTLANPQMVAETTAAKMLGDNDDIGTGLSKGFADTFIEMATERMGAGIVGKALGLVAGKAIGKTQVGQRVKEWAVQTLSASKGADYVAGVAKKAGFNGVLGELMEERYGEAARGATGLEDNFGVLGQLAGGDRVAAMKQLAAEALAFAVPGMPAAAMRVGAAVRNRLAGTQPSTAPVAPSTAPVVPPASAQPTEGSVPPTPAPVAAPEAPQTQPAPGMAPPAPIAPEAPTEAPATPQQPVVAEPPKHTPAIGEIQAEWFTSEIPGVQVEDHPDRQGWKLTVPSGHSIDVRVTQKIDPTPERLQGMQHDYGGRISDEAFKAQRVNIRGLFRGKGEGISGLGLVTLSQAADQEDARHELVHAAFRWLLTREEQAKLVSSYSPDWKTKDAKQIEEDIAQGIAPSDRKGRARIDGNKLVAKTKKFIAGIAKKMGFGGLLAEKPEKIRSLAEVLGAPDVWQRPAQPWLGGSKPPAETAAPVASPTAAKKTVKLYRAEPKPSGKSVMDDPVLSTHPDIQRMVQAAGRWWTDDPEEAKWYVENEYPDGRLRTIEVSAEEVEKYRVSNLKPEDLKELGITPHKFSRRPEKEFFLPRNLIPEEKAKQPTAVPPPAVGTTSTKKPASVPYSTKYGRYQPGDVVEAVESVQPFGQATVERVEEGPKGQKVYLKGFQFPRLFSDLRRVGEAAPETEQPATGEKKQEPPPPEPIAADTRSPDVSGTVADDIRDASTRGWNFQTWTRNRKKTLMALRPRGALAAWEKYSYQKPEAAPKPAATKPATETPKATGKEEQAVEAFAQGMLKHEREFMQEHQPDKLTKVTPEMTEDFLQRKRQDARDMIAGMADKTKLYEMVRKGRFDPNNKLSRQIFEAVAGLKLPPGQKASEEAIKRFIGPEIIEAHAKKRADEKASKEKEEKEKDEARYAQSIEKLKQQFPTSIHGSDLLMLARHYGIDVNLRVQGTLNKKVSQVTPSYVRMSGGGDSSHIMKVRRQVAEAIAAEEKKEPEAPAAEKLFQTPQQRAEPQPISESFAASGKDEPKQVKAFVAHARRLFKAGQVAELPKEFRDPDAGREAMMQRFRGEPRPGLVQKMKDAAKLLWHAYSRENIHLPNNAKYASWNNFFRKLQGVPQETRARTVALLNRSLEKLQTPMQFRVFERYLVYKDLLHAAETLDQKKFGFDGADQIKERIAAYDHMLAFPEYEPVREALKDREAARREVVSQLVERKMLEPEALDNDAYFHRQVFQNAEERFGGQTGLGGIRERRRAFQKARTQALEGAEHNVNYFESESKWMHDALMELAKARMMDGKLKTADKYRSFKKTADTENHVAVMGGQANYDRGAEIRDERKKLKKGSKARKELYEELKTLDPLLPFQNKMGMARGMLRKAGFDTSGDEFLDRVAEFADRHASHSVPELREDWSDLDRMVIGARTFLKAIRDKETFLRERLGDEFRTWEDTLDEHNAAAGKDEQLKPWFIRENNLFFKAFTLPDRMVRQLTSGLMDALEVSVEDLREVRAMGNKGRPLLLLAPVVDQLDTLTRKPSTGNPTLDRVLQTVLDPARMVQSAVKQYLLHNPRAVIGYNIGNVTTDASIYASHKGLKNFIPRAWREIGKIDKSKLSFPTPEAEAAFEHGVLGAGEAAAARTSLDYESLPDFGRFRNRRWRGLPVRALKGYFRKAGDVSEKREDVTRYGAFLYFRDRLAKGTLEYYGGSKRETVEALLKTDGLDAAAAYMARNEFGDYGGSSVAAQWMSWPMPFYRWTESVFRRVPRQFINAYQAGDAKMMAMASGKMTLQIAKPIVLASLGRLLLPQLFAWAWNNLMMGDDEDKLSKQQQNRSHLTLGHTADGSPITINNTTLLGEFASYFGADEAFNQLYDYAFREKGTENIHLADIPRAMAKGSVNRVIQAGHPLAKGAIEGISGYSTYPDAFNPRPRPRDEIAAQMLRMTDELQDAKGFLFGTGERGRPLDKRLATLFVRVFDGQDAALEDILSAREKFLESKGIDVSSGHGVSQFRTMRQAARHDDFDAFRDARDTWIEASPRNAYRGFQSFLSKRDPLSGVPKDMRSEFINEYMDSRQRQRLDVARNFANQQRDKLWIWWKKAGESDAPEVRARFEEAEEKELVNHAQSLAAVPAKQIALTPADRLAAKEAGETFSERLQKKRAERDAEITEARDWFQSRLEATSPSEILQAAERARKRQKISAPALQRLKSELRTLSP
jgi:hypothetical protein